ncbi:hypothetical protein AOQ84DRAFT_138291 [Glonium stellatum]|uniref:Uncharacterized protein n=1 Tax=Glonium stellatum TaxID=574774 RepID=A0A8E2JNJ2_9PEZI|nr:hypothetical protein AOQ84DRAFT_138291 [Glonium stellatum]
MAELNIILIGTCDTKLSELLYLRSQIIQHPNTSVTLIDVGRNAVQHSSISITQPDLVHKFGSALPSDTRELSDLPRGEVIKYMSACATACVDELFASGGYHGIISAGGSGGTALASAAMRNALPIGFPKLIISTVASGDTGPVVGETDITMMYSVVDVAGLNSLLRQILSNAAGAIVGMVRTYWTEHQQNESRTIQQHGQQKKRVGITMFGVTTPCVDAIRSHLESNYDIEVYVFHATGHGGRAMERLIKSGHLDAVLDLTTTEICDCLMGGNMSAGPSRLEAAAKAGIPNIISLGATDMVNFGPKATVPERYAGRLLFEHNPTVTLMRTSSSECASIGQFIVDKLLKFAVKKENVQVWMPEGGVSMISTPGGAFADAEADEYLFRAIQKGLQGRGVKVISDQRAINDEGFANDIAEALIRVMGLKRNSE